VTLYTKRMRALAQFEREITGFASPTSLTTIIRRSKTDSISPSPSASLAVLMSHVVLLPIVLSK
jgi:hypothetical protein